MRTTSWSLTMTAVVCWACLGCGGGDRSEAPPTVTSTAPTTASGDGYELDVIAEAEPDEGEPPLTVKFVGYVEEDEGSPWVFAWNFGDGQHSADQNPTHTYTEVGDYTAVLTVTDARGNTGSDEIDIFVEHED